MIPRRQSITWATTAMAAAAGSSQAELVEITLIDNPITASGGNQIFADLDGDGEDDIVMSSSGFWSNELVETSTGSFYLLNGAQLRIDGLLIIARSVGDTEGFKNTVTAGPEVGSTGLIKIALTGTSGNAWLEVTRRANGWSAPMVGDPGAGVYLTRVIYDTDPEGAAEPDVGTHYPVVGAVDKDGFRVEITTFTVADGTATIILKGRPNTAYTCKSSTTLADFTAMTPTSGSTTTDANGDASFEVDATGPKRFYRIED